MALNTSLRTTVTQLNRMRTSVGQTATGLTRLRTSTGDADKAVDGIKKSAGPAGTSVGKLRTAAKNGSEALNKLRTSARNGNESLGKLRTTAGRGDDAVRKLRSGVRSADSAFDKAKGGSDKLRSSLDRMRRSADRAKSALQGVKRQADAVERSVGRAGRNADRGGKSMGQLGKGARGASAAQRGLNLAMAANPFGLVMALLAPLITKFVDMDKVARLVRRGVSAAWSGIRSASSGASRFLKPLLTGVVNAFRSPVVQLVRGLNVLIGAMNRIKFKVPGWVPGLGGKGFGFDLPRIPVPHLAEGGVVRARPGGTLALVAERGESEAVIPLSRLERMLGNQNSGASLRRLAEALERLAERPVHVDVDAQTIARAVFSGQRKLARR